MCGRVFGVAWVSGSEIKKKKKLGSLPSFLIDPSKYRLFSPRRIWIEMTPLQETHLSPLYGALLSLRLWRTDFQSSLDNNWKVSLTLCMLGR